MHRVSPDRGGESESHSLEFSLWMTLIMQIVQTEIRSTRLRETRLRRRS